MNKLTTTFALSFMAIAGPALTAGDVIVSYDPSEYSLDYDVDFERVATSAPGSSNAKVAPFSDAEPLLQTGTSGYNGPSIYGGYQFSTTNGDWSFGREQVRHNTKGDHAITLQSYSGETWAGADMALHAVFLFEKSDFNPPFNTKAVSVDGFSIKWNTYFKGTDRNVIGRYVVQIGGELYVSDFDFGMTNRGSSQLGKQHLAGIQWAPYDAATDLNFDAESAEYKTMALDDVTGVGVYVEEDRWIGDGSVSAPYMLSITSFEAKGEF